MAQQTVCPHCGFRNSSISNFCARCEQPLRDAAGRPTQATAASASGNVPAPLPPVASPFRPPTDLPPRRRDTPTAPLPAVPTAAQATQVAAPAYGVHLPRHGSGDGAQRAAQAATYRAPNGDPSDRTQVTPSPVAEVLFRRPPTPRPAPPAAATPLPSEASTQVAQQRAADRGLDWVRPTEPTQAFAPPPTPPTLAAAQPRPSDRITAPDPLTARAQAPAFPPATEQSAGRPADHPDPAPSSRRRQPPPPVGLPAQEWPVAPATDDGSPPYRPTVDASAPAPSAASSDERQAATADLRWRQAAAVILDLAVGVAAVVAYVSVEMVLTGKGWPNERATGLEALAWWCYVHHRVARHACLVALLAATAYSAVGVRRGATLGRAALGLRLQELVGPAGEAGALAPASWRTAAWQVVGNAFCWLSFGAGFYWMVVDGRGRSWANLVSRTVVVRHLSSER